MKPVATIILNRNLPEITDKLYKHLKKFDGKETDIYVIESGSIKKDYQNTQLGTQTGSQQ